MKKNMSILILTLMFMSISISSCFAKTIKFAQVTDVYFKKQSVALNKIVKDINKSSDIDFVVFTGNNIGQANPKNLEGFLSVVKKLNKPYYLVLGNKDVSKLNNLDKKTYISMVRKVNRNQGRTPNYVFKRNDIVYIVVDGTREVIPGINGVYTNETISWLDAQLTKYAYNKVVILQHFPLANKPSNDLYYTYNTLPYLQMLSKHNNVIAIVSGHYHKNDEVMYNGVYHITSPQSSNGVYKIIEIDVDNGYEVFTILKEIE